MTNSELNRSDKNSGHANQSFRFVQLSDLHLSSPGFPNPYQLFNKRILGYLSWLKKRRYIHQPRILECAIQKIAQLNADHHVITGDLLHIGLKNEFEQSEKWLTQLDPPTDTTIIPGNHDLYVKERWSRSFRYWLKYMEGDQRPNLQNLEHDDALEILNSLYPIVRIRKQIMFIGISSVFESPWFRATGLISSDQILRLGEILNNPEYKNYCKVLLVHHPITLTHTKRRKSLLNHNELTKLLAESPVNMVLHGHEHKSSIEYLYSSNNHKIPLVGIASTSSNSEVGSSRAEFALYEIEKDNKKWKIKMNSYKFNKSIEMFEMITSELL